MGNFLSPAVILIQAIQSEDGALSDSAPFILAELESSGTEPSALFLVRRCQELFERGDRIKRPPADLLANYLPVFRKIENGSLADAEHLGRDFAADGQHFDRLFRRFCFWGDCNQHSRGNSRHCRELEKFYGESIIM